MDRVTDFESGGWGFDSLWGRWGITGGLSYNSARFVLNWGEGGDGLSYNFIESGWQVVDDDVAFSVNNDGADEIC